MAIEFHCDHCGHLVRTGDENAGKRGRCPHCHNSVYIPTPTDQIEPLRLEPIDPNEERERQKLMDETRRITQKIQSEKDTLPPEPSRPAPPSAEPLGDIRLRPDMETLVVEYAACMAAGKLAEAQELAAEIRRDKRRAEEVIQRLTMDDLPPLKLAKIPHPVLVGFLKQLRE